MHPKSGVSRIFSVSLKLLKRRDWAEDVTQEAYVRVWYHAKEYHTERGQPLTWMISILRNLAIDKLRSRSAQEVEGDESPDELASGGLGSVKQMMQSQSAMALGGCIDELSEAQRTSIFLSFFEGLSHQQVTARMDEPLGKARLRFERLQMESYRVRQSVWEWEQRLYPMSDGIEDETPPDTLWRDIQQRIHPQKAESTPSRWRSLFSWRSWGAVATTMAGVLAVMISLQSPPPGVGLSEDYMAVFNNPEAQPLWMISSDLQTGEISIRAVNAMAAAVDKTFELWMLPAGNVAPRSLGLMPVSGNKQKYVLSPALVDILRNAKGLAVSIEPTGGSPTGVPTGPVVYQAELIAI